MTFIVVVFLILGSVPDLVHSASSTEQKTLEPPVYHFLTKVGDWAEYLVDEAVNATVLCNSDVNPAYYLPLSKGDRVRITITEISENPGYAEKPENGAKEYGYHIPTLSVSLNGVKIRTNMLNFIPLFPGPPPMANMQWIHTTREDGYWGSFNTHWEYVATHYTGYASNFTLTLSGDRAAVHCILFGDVLDCLYSRSLGVPVEISGSRSQTINQRGGSYRVKLSATNIVGLIGAPRPKAVTIQPINQEDTSTASVRISWSRSDDADFARYEVYNGGVRLDSDPGRLVATITNREETSCSVTGLDPASFYYLTVRVHTTGCYADSDTVCIRTLSQSPDQPVRLARIDVANPELINTSNPLLVNLRVDCGFKLKIENVSAPSVIEVYNITTIPADMRTEPFRIDSFYGRFNTIGDVLWITISGSSGFYGDIQIYTSEGDTLEKGLSEVQKQAIYLRRWRVGELGWAELWYHEEIRSGNYYSNVYFFQATPVVLISSTLDETSGNTVRLTWSKNDDPDFWLYKVYMSTTPGDIGSDIAQTTGMSYNVTVDDPNTVYFFTIKTLTTSSMVSDIFSSDSNIVRVSKTPPRPATINVVYLQVSKSVVKPGEEVEVSATLENTGELSGNYTLVFSLDGKEKGSIAVTLDGGWGNTWTMTLNSSIGGVHLVSAGDQSASFEVETTQQTTGGFNVIVKDSSGALISGASVSSTSQPSGQAALGGATGADGTVDFNNVLLGVYTVQASKSSYVSAAATGTVTAGSRGSISLTLEAQQSSGGGIPGYPAESVLIGLILIVIILTLRSYICASRNTRNSRFDLIPEVLDE